MSIEADLVTFLKATGSVTTYVGSRVYTDKRTQSAGLPAITIHTIGGGEVHTLASGAGLAQPTIQLSVWDDDRVGCIAVREALRNLLQGYAGTWGSTTRIGGVQFQSGPFLFETDEVGGDAGTYHQPIDLTIWYGQTVPTNT